MPVLPSLTHTKTGRTIFFQGNSPSADPTAFASNSNATVYYLPGTSGWGSTLAGCPAVMLSSPTVTTPPSAEVVLTGANATFAVVASGAPAPSFQWQVSADGGQTWNNVSGSGYAGATTSILTINAPSSALLGCQYKAIVTNQAGTTGTTPVPLVVGTSSAKITWLQSNFSPAQLGNPAIVGDMATPAHDGIPNLLKYAFNLNALANGQGAFPQPTQSGSQASLVFQAMQPDLTYTVQASTDLSNWSTAGVTTQTNGSQVTANYSLPGNTPVFLHLVITPTQ